MQFLRGRVGLRSTQLGDGLGDSQTFAKLRDVELLEQVRVELDEQVARDLVFCNQRRSKSGVRQLTSELIANDILEALGLYPRNHLLDIPARDVLT